MNNKLLQASLAELVGTFILVFVGGFAVAWEQGVVVAALAHGIILVSIVYTYGHLSGAHVNPAVTAGLRVGNQIKLDRAVYYWVAQFAGAVIAAVALNTLVPGTNVGQTTGSLTNSAVWGRRRCSVRRATWRGWRLASRWRVGLIPARTFGPALIAGNLSYVLLVFYWH